ncbi:MAG: ATP-dependent DNA helicase UvrD2 [Acidimicrobiales bacterium]
MPVNAPAALGRGLVIVAGAPVPPPWTGVPVVRVDEQVLADAGQIVVVLHRHWSAREPVVVELAVDPGRFRAPMSVPDEPWSLGPSFEPWHDRLHFLVWANSYDGRDGDLVWWWARKAERLGATVQVPGQPGDCTLADGVPVWIDGGPRGPLEPALLGGAGIVHREAVDAGRLVPDPAPVAPTADLAPDQLAAVAHGAGPVRVIAPAGSGKTRVLTERVRHLLVDRGYERSGVLAVAYNKRAQEEMLARTTDVRPRVQTLNALAFEILGQARGRRPRVLDEIEVRGIVEQLVPKGRPLANTDRLAPYLEALTAVRLGLRDPAEVEASRDDVPGFAEAFAPFRRRLDALGSVDFDEQVYGAVEALLVDGALRRSLQAGCRHLLVDEFQDLTPAHVLLLRLLALPGLDVFGVGDDDQTIYSYAGADPSFLIDFAELFPGGGAHPLEVNYRCPEAVVEGARTLLGYNSRRVPKVIRPGPGAEVGSDALRVIRHRPEAGAGELVDVVQAWLSAGAAPADVAVLTRVGSLLLAPQIALVEAGVPVIPALDARVLDRTGTRAALAYLRIGVDPDHLAGADVVEVYRRPTRGLPSWITKWFERCRSIGDVRGVADRVDDAKVAAKVVAVADDLEQVARAVRGGTTRTALLAVRDRVGLGKAMDLLDTSKGGQAASQLDDLEALVQVAALHPDPAGFEPWLRGLLVGRRPEGDDGVTLATVHRVKGQEWDHVAVFGVTDGLLPHRLADDHEEERRVLHVAITRGRRRVVVLADAERPSPFVDELAGTAPVSVEREPVRRAAERRRAAPAAGGRAPRPTGEPWLEAAPGTEVVARGGITGTVRSFDAEGALLGLPGGGALRVRPGEVVTVDGREVALVPSGTLALRAALGSWRTDRYKADGVPPYVVASDKVLDALAVSRPSTAGQLLAIVGIGQAKAETYGEDILAVVREHQRPA